MTFERSLVFALFEVPESDGCVFGGGGNNIIERMQNNFSDFSSMALQGILLWLSGESVTHFEGTAAAATKAFRKLLTSLTSSAVFNLLDLLLEVPNLLFQPSERGPLLF